MTTHTKFKAKIYVLTAAEGGRTDKFYNGYRPQFVFGSASMSGVITLPEDVQIVFPGDTLHVTAEIIEPVAMEPGLSFEAREPGDKTVIRGEVTEILK